MHRQMLKREKCNVYASLFIIKFVLFLIGATTNCGTFTHLINESWLMANSRSQQH